MIAYERGATHLLNKEQIQAIENINSLYQQVFKQSDELGLSLQNDYGLANPHELLAELSNPSFVEKLKKINVFEKLIDNIIQLFVSIKEIAGLKKTNAYDTLKNNVADIIQNYKSDFTQQYNNLKIRNITLNNKDTIQTKPFAYHTQTPKGIASLRADLKEALSPYINKEITNKETGLSGTISIKEINKISSSKAVDKSIYNGFSRDEHFKVSEHLKELFENAHLKQTHTDYKERPNIQAVHRFNTPLSINDKEAVAKITLFEKRLGNNKIYSLELEGLSSAPLSKDADNTGAAVKAQSVESPHNKSTTIAKTDEAIIPQLQQKFKYDATKAKDLLDWHKDSSPLTKDEQGLPKVFYHGSKAENLQVFDNSFDSSKWGFWFGTDKDFVLEAFADSNKEQFTQAFLKMKNPLDATKTFDTKTLQELKGIFNLDNKDIALYKSLSKEFANIKKELNKKGFAFVSYGGGLVEAKPLLHKNKDLINELYEEWNILTDKERKGYTKDRAGLIEALQKDLGLFKDDLTLKNIIKYYDTAETLFFNPRELIALNRFDNQAPQALRDIQHLDSELGLLLGMKGKAQYSNINTRELLQAKGYDGIILNDDVSVVFNPNQIKAVENRGLPVEPTQAKNLESQLKEVSKEEALKSFENLEPAQLPKELNVKEFLESLEHFKNKENFIKHLQKKQDAQARMAYLNLIEPTIKEFDYLLTKGERKQYIKAFKADEKRIFELLLTQDKDKTLITHLPKARKAYIKSKIKNADLIQIFTSRASKEQSLNGLAEPIISQNNKSAEKRKYFNESSPNIYHSNPHLGSGLVGGSVAGFETDEQGNLSFNPQNFLLGLAGGAIGSKAVAQGLKALKDNPAFKEKLQQELANTLSRGWESAIKQYPILQSLEPRYIVKNEKGREIQAKGVLKEVEKEQIYSLRESAKQTLSSIVGENIVNIHDGRIAQVSKRNIGKMVSDKAIAKSVANGFTAMEHFNAVNDIKSLYKNAIFKETQKDNKSTNPNTLIHRYESVYDNQVSALITLKESLDPNTKGNKIYTLELEELKSLELKASAPDPQGESLSSRNLGYAEPKTPDKNPKSILPQKATQKLKEYIEVKEKIANIESMNFGNNRELSRQINKKGIKNITVPQYREQLRNQYGYDTLLKRREELQQEINNFTPQEKNPFTLENFNEDLAKGFKECMRVLKSNGTLIFKWSEAQISLSEILSCFDKDPLLMQKTSRTSHFCVFYKG